MCLEDSGGLFAIRTLSCTRVLPEIQLRQAQRRKRNVDVDCDVANVFDHRLSVRNGTMTSAPAHHDHNVFAGEESRRSVVQTRVQLMAIHGLQDASHNSRISTNVRSQALVAVGISRTFCSQSCILSDRCTLQRSCLQNCRQNMSVVCLRSQLIVASPRICDGAASTKKFVQNSSVHSSRQSV